MSVLHTSSYCSLVRCNEKPCESGAFIIIIAVSLVAMQPHPFPYSEVQKDATRPHCVISGVLSRQRLCQIRPILRQVHAHVLLTFSRPCGTDEVIGAIERRGEDASGRVEGLSFIEDVPCERVQTAGEVLQGVL